MVGNLKKWKGETLSLPFTLPGGGTDTLLAERGEPQATGHIIRFSWSSALSFAEVIEQTGELPIPPTSDAPPKKATSAPTRPSIPR